MGTSTILQLPQAVGLTGTEQLEAVQYGRSVRILTSQLAAIAPGAATGVVTATGLTGTINNYQITTAVGMLYLTATGGANITGMTPGSDFQIVTIINGSGPTITLNAVNGGSSVGNQFLMPADVGLSQNQTKTFRYSQVLQYWVAM